MLVVGSESRGLNQQVLQYCDRQITIPQFGLTRSLNICVAIGMFLFEYRRQMSVMQERERCQAPQGQAVLR